MIHMKIKTGYLYHIKDEYFDVVDDDSLMQNHEKGKKRPTYFTIKDGKILWFIPVSSKVDKYKKIVNNKIKKYGFCNTIIIEKLFNDESVILLQNAFPTLEKYIDHIHTENGAPVRVADNLKNEILYNFNSLLAMKRQGINLFFTDIDKIKEKMLNALENDKLHK